MALNGAGPPRVHDKLLLPPDQDGSLPEGGRSQDEMFWTTERGLSREPGALRQVKTSELHQRGREDL